MPSKQNGRARAAPKARVAPAGATPAATSPSDAAATLEGLARRLATVKAHLETEAAQFASGPLFAQDFDGLVSAAQLATQQQTDELLRDLLAQRLEDLEHATRRARRGQYGTCESCGFPIPHERLLAVPHATHCIACQRQRERGRLRRVA